MQGPAIIERADGQIKAVNYEPKDEKVPKRPLSKVEAVKWNQQLQKLQHYESQIASSDKQVNYFVQKYKPF